MRCSIPNFHQYVRATILSLVIAANLLAQEVSIDFESADVGKPIASWSEKEVNFDLAHAPRKNKAKGRVMFFPHLGTGHKGILNAMAEESIPLRITFPKPVSRATLTLWGSTTSSALVEAFDLGGNVVAKQQLEQVPRRKAPEEHIPFFELTIEGPHIERIQLSGALAGGYVAVDEIKFIYADTEAAKNSPPYQGPATGKNQ